MKTFIKKISVIPLTFSFLLCILQYSQITANAARVYYANSTSHNSILLPNNSYTIVCPNSINTFQLSAQMWNNTTPTGTPLSNWTATA